MKNIAFIFMNLFILPISFAQESIHTQFNHIVNQYQLSEEKLAKEQPSIVVSEPENKSFERPHISVVDNGIGAIGNLKDNPILYSNQCQMDEGKLSPKQVLNSEKKDIPLVFFNVDLNQYDVNDSGKEILKSFNKIHLNTPLGIPTALSNIKKITYVSQVLPINEHETINSNYDFVQTVENKKIYYSHINEGHTIFLQPKMIANKMMISLCYHQNSLISMKNVEQNGVMVGIPDTTYNTVVQRYMLDEQTKNMSIALPNHYVLNITTHIK